MDVQRPGSSVFRQSILFAVAASGLFGALQHFKQTDQDSKTIDPYRVLEQRSRFACAMARLPHSGRIGYLSDAQDSPLLAATLHITAQYTLAPRLLMSQGEKNRPEWHVGNFSRPADYAATGARFGLTLVEDCGQGVVVFRLGSR